MELAILRGIYWKTCRASNFSLLTLRLYPRSMDFLRFFPFTSSRVERGAKGDTFRSCRIILVDPLICRYSSPPKSSVDFSPITSGPNFQLSPLEGRPLISGIKDVQVNRKKVLLRRQIKARHRSILSPPLQHPRPWRLPVLFRYNATYESDASVRAPKRRVSVLF